MHEGEERGEKGSEEEAVQPDRRGSGQREIARRLLMSEGPWSADLGNSGPIVFSMNTAGRLLMDG